MDALSITLNLIRIRRSVRQRRMDADDWVTIKGTHVLIDENGVAQSGGKLKGMTFSKAKSIKSKKKSTAPKAHKVVQGSDIAGSYEGKGDIKSVIKAQGFDSIPKVVTKDEFNKALKASGIIAQRVYAASDQKTLDAYREALYSGEWYVECTEGGSVFGQGMYTAADHNGKLSDDTKNEMRNYAKSYTDYLKSTGHENPVYYVETMTMDPSAKIADYGTLMDEWNGDVSDPEKEKIRRDNTDGLYRQIGEKYGRDAETYARFQGFDPKISGDMAEKAMKSLDSKMRTLLYNRSKRIEKKAEEKIEEAVKKKKAHAAELQSKFGDTSAYAAAMGYDAVKKEFGEGYTTYTIILNRSKLVILDGRQRKDAEDEAGVITFRMGKGGRIEAVQDGKVVGWVIADNYKAKG